MKKIIKLGICGMLCATLSAGSVGCANIKNDSTRTQTEGTLVGAGGGALLGGLLGQLFGKSTSATLVGAGIGAAAGALGGFFVGKHVAQKKAEYASQEEWLDACITHAQQVNKETKEVNEQLNIEISKLNKECTKLEKQYKKQQASKSDLKKQLDLVEKEKKELAETITKLQNELEQQKSISSEARASGNTKEAKKIDNEIAELKRQISTMKAYNKKLANISARLAV